MKIVLVLCKKNDAEIWSHGAFPWRATSSRISIWFSFFLDRADVLKAKKETDGHSTEEEEEEEAQQVVIVDVLLLFPQWHVQGQET